MSVITKIMTLVRGSAREIGESVVDANATRIYEQEVVEAKASIASAKTELTGVMAKEMQTARAIEKLRSEVSRYEGLAVEALDNLDKIDRKGAINPLPFFKQTIGALAMFQTCPIG